MKTAIVCTIAEHRDINLLEEMAKAGMKYVRLNCSHGGMDDPFKFEIIEKVKQLREKGYDLTLLLDTKGPDIRIGRFDNFDGKNNINGFAILKEGQEFILTTDECLGNTEKVFVQLPQLPKKVKPGQIVLLSDGMIKLEVVKVKGSDVHCKVILGGKLMDRKTLFAPGCDLGLPFMADYDKNDLIVGKKAGMDVVAASFVNSEADLIEMQTFMKENDCVMPIISKIESSGGIADIDKIIALGDGIMVARGDLGVEYPVEQIPALQEMIVKKCNAADKFVIVATEMMESMRENPRPTRAEVTDAWNAVRQGANAIMTSAETATGKFPLETVQFMARIAKEVGSK
ncbi:MAG: pyruvate kinase [Firmicutes bacterium]|nr:pyruvate kinase [Bacillota bacterium]